MTAEQKPEVLPDDRFHLALVDLDTLEIRESTSLNALEAAQIYEEYELSEKGLLSFEPHHIFLIRLRNAQADGKKIPDQTEILARAGTKFSVFVVNSYGRPTDSLTREELEGQREGLLSSLEYDFDDAEPNEPKEIQVISEALARVSGRLKERRYGRTKWDNPDPELMELRDTRDKLRERSWEVQYNDIIAKMESAPVWETRKIARWRREASFLLRHIHPHAYVPQGLS